jgi:glyoxylase-like metal-dependent hydrolase (beta-lactamase superfamily II)
MIAGMQEIDEGLWRWTARHPEWHPGEFGAEVASFTVQTDDATLLVDPLLPEGEHDAAVVLAALDGLAREQVAILISIPYHVRSAEDLAERYDATVYGHPAAAKRLRSPQRLKAIDASTDSLPAGVRAFAIGKPKRFEMPFWLPSHSALVFGDAVVEVDGELRVWAQSAVDADRSRFHHERFNPTLRPLVELGAQRVLVTHGQPVLSDGAAELARALEREPFWHHG